MPPNIEAKGLNAGIVPAVPEPAVVEVPEADGLVEAEGVVETEDGPPHGLGIGAELGSVVPAVVDEAVEADEEGVVEEDVVDAVPERASIIGS